MAAYQGAYYSAQLTFTDSAGVAQDLTGWTFTAQARVNVDDSTVLLTLTSANTGFVIINASLGQLKLQLTSVQTTALPLGKVLLDIERTDASPGPIWLCRVALKVKKSVTR